MRNFEANQSALDVCCTAKLDSYSSSYDVHAVTPSARRAADRGAGSPGVNRFVTEQIEEEATVSEALGRLRLFGDKPEGLLMLDKELGGMAATMAQAGVTGPTVTAA